MEGVQSNKQKEVQDLIINCLKDVVKKGIDKDLIESSLHQLEIRQREITGSGMPYGLQIMLSCLPACIHNDDPLKVLDLDSSFSIIKDNLKEDGYIEKIINEKIIKNNHRVNYALIPDPEFNNKNEEKIKNKIAKKSKDLSDIDKQQIIDLASELKKRQESIDDPEILPKVTKEDIPHTRNYAKSTITNIGNTNNYFYKTGTNGITYHSMIYPCSNLSTDELKIASLFANSLTNIGFNNMSYEEVQKIQAAITGGISSNFILLPNSNNSEHKLALKITSKSLEKNVNKMQDILIKTISDADFANESRIKDLLNFVASDSEKSIVQNGHILAMSNAAAQVNNIAATNDITSGLNFITNTSNLSKTIDQNNNLEEYINLLSSIKDKIKTSPIYTFTASSLSQEKTNINFKFESSDSNLEIQNYLDIQNNPVGWITGAQVCYCAEAFPTVDSFHDDAPALTVLGAVLRNGYLHSAIREKGGAYGAGAMQDSNNKIFKFFSYRDPRCAKTFDDFEKSRRWSLKNISEEQLNEGILGVISSIDKPLSPYGEAMNDFINILDNKDKEKRLAFRSKIKDCTIDDLVEVSRKYLFNESKRSLIAGESYTEEIKSLNFDIRNI